VPNTKSHFSAPPTARPLISQAERIDAAAARLRNQLPLSAADVCALVGWSRRTLLDRCTSGRFPPPAIRAGKGTGRGNLWVASEVRAYLNQLVSSSGSLDLSPGEAQP
jgi:predicted DNA-binding transcriptional regulator AlpA